MHPHWLCLSSQIWPSSWPGNNIVRVCFVLDSCRVVDLTFVDQDDGPELPFKLARTTHTIVPPSTDLGLWDDDGWALMFTQRPGFVHLADGENYGISMVWLCPRPL
jgi:hypothetical protein